MTADLQKLFANNRAWAAEMRMRTPDFFERLARQQAPQYLWIGCSDSRVPANQIVGLAPGELFVHRNVANVAVGTDLNCMSVLQFAVDVLGVREIIVCGHYGCGGVRAVLDGARWGLVDSWLLHVNDVARAHDRLLTGIDSYDDRFDRLCELNVIEQVRNVALSTVARDAWQRGSPLTIHGVIYGIHDGLLQDLGIRIAAPEEIEPAFRAAVEARHNESLATGNRRRLPGDPIT